MNENIKAGADIHAGDGGYEESTHEKYEAFVKVRNQSLNKARIRDFERQSGLEIFGLGARREIWEAALEKYAELIVRECCSKLVEMGESWHEFARNPPQGQAHNASGALFAAYRLKEDAVDEIKEHFGVEE